MTTPTPNNMPHTALTTAREDIHQFDRTYTDGIDDITAIWRALRWETGIPNDTAAALLAIAVYQVNAPEPEEG